MAKILLVEDDLDLASIVRDSLDAQDHSVDHAGTGRLAREKLAANQYELVILDWDLPGVSGFDILREFRASGGSTPVMMLTGRATFEEKEQGLDAGADDYLTKPFAMKELSARVRSLLRRAGQTTTAQPLPAAPTTNIPTATAGVPAPSSFAAFQAAPVTGQHPMGIPASASAQATAPFHIGPGQILEGKYLLKEPIGEGGMGQVWLGMHTVMNRPIVIKFLADHLLDNPIALERFKQESQALARLNNPHIVNVYEIGLSGTQPFLIMEYVKGFTIGRIIEKHGAAPVKVALDVVAQICRGLQVAHNAGVIHRDLKPENIIVYDTPEKKHFAKIVDFGIAYFDGTLDRVTEEGTMVGTVEYLAPEQLNDEKVDSRSDLYALGVVLFEMLTGDLPYDATTTRTLLIKKVVESAKRIFQKRPDLAEGSAVDRILEKALQRDPACRYQTADEMRLDLERALSQL